MRVHPKVGQVTPQEFAPGICRGQGASARSERDDHRSLRHLHPLSRNRKNSLRSSLMHSENKYYCPGVGIVNELDVKGGTVNTGLTRIINP